MTGVTHILSRLLAAGALAFVAACSSTATDTGAQVQAANAAWLAMDFTCQRADAASVELAALRAHPAQYAEKCIRTKAFADANFLYDDAGQMQRAKTAPGLAAYWKDSDVAHRLHLGPSFVTIVGRVRSCEERTKRADALHPVAPCRAPGMAIFVSEAQIIPTAMD
jgi:hypothetical protein